MFITEMLMMLLLVLKFKELMSLTSVCLCLSQSLRQSWYSWLSFLSSLQLWQTALKTVSGRFGTGVLSYFVFLRKLFFFNVFLFLVTGLFLVVPQAVRPPKLTSVPSVQYGLEVLTGTVRLSFSIM